MTSDFHSALVHNGNLLITVEIFFIRLRAVRQLARDEFAEELLLQCKPSFGENRAVSRFGLLAVEIETAANMSLRSYSEPHNLNTEKVGRQRAFSSRPRGRCGALFEERPFVVDSDGASK